MEVWFPATPDRLARWAAAGLVEADERAVAVTAVLRRALGLVGRTGSDDADEAAEEEAADAALTQAARASVELLAGERLDGLAPTPRRVVLVAEVPDAQVRPVDDDDAADGDDGLAVAPGEVRLSAPVARDAWLAVHADVDGTGDGLAVADLVAAAVEGLADDGVDPEEALRRAEVVDEVELGWHDVSEVDVLLA